MEIKNILLYFYEEREFKFFEHLFLFKNDLLFLG